MNIFKPLSLILFCSFFICAPLWAVELNAEGIGKTDTESRANATSELSFIIYSDVKSSVSVDMSDDPANQKQIVRKQTDVISALPIYNAEYKTEQVGNVFQTKARLSSDKALSVYKAEIDKSIQTINDTYELILSEKSASAKYAYTMSVLSSFENLEKLKIVLNVLGGEYKKYPNVTIEQIQNIKSDIGFKSDSMRHAAALIAAELKKDAVYVYYPMFNGSDEVTQFSSVFRDLIASNLKSVDSIYSADFFIETNYSVSDSGMYISATLTDKQGITLAKSVKMLEPKSYAGLKTEPESLSFEKLLKMGLSTSSDFFARISSQNGKKAMLYRSGDAVELFVKLNKPGYFFLVGHVDKNGQRFSYIVDFYNTKGLRKFIRHIDADEINRWISIGEFDIVPPFGLETFQMIATIKDPVDMIPSNVFEPESELYIVNKDINKGVNQTRALKLRPENIDAVAEDVLIFSTIDK